MNYSTYIVTIYDQLAILEWFCMDIDNISFSVICMTKLDVSFKLT